MGVLHGNLLDRLTLRRKKPSNYFRRREGPRRPETFLRYAVFSTIRITDGPLFRDCASPSGTQHTSMDSLEIWSAARGEASMRNRTS